jgi:hypothetical protein
MIRDRDRIYGTVVTRRLRTMGIRDKPTAPASPWQNGFAERQIGSIRRECLDHVIVLGEAHLRRILKNYADYYNGVRTHRSLNKDAPVSRPVQRSGVISSHALWADIITATLGFKFSGTHRGSRAAACMSSSDRWPSTTCSGAVRSRTRCTFKRLLSCVSQGCHGDLTRQPLLFAALV